MQVYLTCSTQISSCDLVCISWQVPKGGCGLFEKYKQRANSRSVGGNVRVPACARLRLFTSRCSEEMVHHSHISIPSKYCVQRQHISARTHTQTHTHDRAPADDWRGAGRTYAARTACACGGCRRGFLLVFCHACQVSASCGFHSRVHLSILKDKVGDTCVQDTCRKHIGTRISLSLSRVSLLQR